MTAIAVLDGADELQALGPRLKALPDQVNMEAYDKAAETAIKDMAKAIGAVAGGNAIASDLGARRRKPSANGGSRPKRA